MATTDQLTVEEFILVRDYLTRRIIKDATQYSDHRVTDAAERLMQESAFDCRASLDAAIEAEATAAELRVVARTKKAEAGA